MDKDKFVYALICAMQQGEVDYEWVIDAALQHMTPEQLLEHCKVMNMSYGHSFESVEEFIETYDDGFGPEESEDEDA